MRLRIEIRPAEGGQDAELFASELAGAYARFATDKGWLRRHETAGDARTHLLLLEGADLSGWENEAGGHRIQRVPKGERNGRVHSSTVTVSVLPDTGQGGPVTLVEDELHLEWYSGSGAGGQHRNKHQNSARLRHLPTGILVTAQCRKREESLRQARAALLERLSELTRTECHGRENRARADQVGTGMRADKRRTYRFRDDRVQDHLTGRSAACSAVMRGRFDLLWA